MVALLGLAPPAFAEAASPDSTGGIDALVGTWTLRGDSRYGPLEHQLVVAADGTATYESNGDVSDVRALEIEGDSVRFEMTVFGGPSNYEMSFAGTLDGNRLMGELVGRTGNFATLEAIREEDEE